MKNHIPFLQYILSCMAKGRKDANTRQIERTHRKYEQYCRKYGIDAKTPPEEHLINLF